jgi:acetyl esterase/lipase
MPTVELLPELAPLADLVPIATINAESLPAMREVSFAGPAELSDQVTRTDVVLPDHPHVTVRVHRPAGHDGALPCLYSMHGGGYVLGSRDMDDPFFDTWCATLGIVGISVEYRLAPETPFPGPLDDCYAGLAWAHTNAADLGIDPNRIGIAGVSAGGGLCAGLALLARDRGEVPVRFQLLDCPMIDDRQTTASSQLDDLVIWNKHSNEFGWRSYLGELYGTDAIPGYAAPARAEDLTGLPPAYVSVGGADGFRDEDISYALRLSQAGVPTELHVYPGAPHGVGLFAGTEIATRYVNDKDDWLRRQFAAMAG